MQHKVDWIGADWGNSNLRIWAMSNEDRVIAQASAPLGTQVVKQTGFETALISLIEPFLNDETSMPVLCSGAVGAREGWAQAPYVPVPCVPPGLSRAIPVNSHDERIAVAILPGICQNTPPDIMRGEETQVAGVIALEKEFDGIVCLPGTQSKWVHVSAGEIVSFQSFMTGDLFHALSEHTILKDSVMSEDLMDQTVFLAAISDAMSRPQGFAAQLVALRARHVLEDASPSAARARLSGLLIGMELAAARPYWLGQRVMIVGSPALAALYDMGLQAQGAMVETGAADQLTVAGLVAAKREAGH